MIDILANFLLSRMVMDGEAVRVGAAVLGTAIAAWYDLTNNRNVPNNFLYAFLAVALIANAVFFSPQLAPYTFGIAIAVFIIGYLFYRAGYVGGADIYVLTSIALLVPVFPSYVNAMFNFPVVLSIVISSGVLFALYFLYFILANIVLRGKKGKYEYLLLLPAWAILVYFLASSGIFGPAYIITVSVLVLSSMLFMVYKEAVTEAMAKKVLLSQVGEEDIAVLELMPELVKKYGIKRLLDEKEILRLKKAKLKELYVYGDLPPFLPFVLAGLLLCVSVGDVLMFSMRIG